MSDAIVILTTAPDAAVARSIGRALVDEKLIACCTIMPGGHSIYRWEGSVEEAEEVVMLMKTTVERFDMIDARIRDLHPYDVPEIITLPITGGSAAYLSWIEEQVIRSE